MCVQKLFLTFRTIFVHNLFSQCSAKRRASDKDSPITGESLSEALIFASTNPQYDDRLFTKLQVQYMKIPSSNLGRTCSAKRRASDKDLPVSLRFENNSLKNSEKLQNWFDQKLEPHSSISFRGVAVITSV